MDQDQDQNLSKKPQAASFNETCGKSDSDEVDASNNVPMTKLQILKNVVVLSVGFLFMFTAYQSMANLQTSLNKEDGVGAYSLAAIYIALIVSSIFLPKLCVARLGCKWTIPLSMIGYAGYMAANLHAVIWLMTIVGAILGVGAAPLWTAKSTYLTQLGVWYSKLTKQPKDAVINKFFVLFYMTIQTTQIWGNLISSSVLEEMPERNETNNVTTDTPCGADFDPTVKTNRTGFTQPPELVRNLFIIYFCFAVAAVVIISTLLDTIKLDKETSAEDRKLSPKLLVVTLKHLVNSPAQMLLVPLTVYRGVGQGFIGADFTQSYVSCALGVSNVGYIFICFGATGAVSSIASGKLVQYLGRVPTFFLAAVTLGALKIILLLWTPESTSLVYFYLIAAFWGMGDAIFQAQVNALFGTLFTKNVEAAFSNYRLWEAIGFMISYLYNDSLVTKYKLYICLFILATGMLGYTVVEVMERKRPSGKAADVTEEENAAQNQDLLVVS